MTRKEKAIELHDKGFNCAQAVACAFAEETGCKNLEQPASKADTYKLTREITKTFLEKNGSLTCGELKGTETGKVLRSCPDCIRDAVEIAESILEL